MGKTSKWKMMITSRTVMIIMNAFSRWKLYILVINIRDSLIIHNKGPIKYNREIKSKKITIWLQALEILKRLKYIIY